MYIQNSKNRAMPDNTVSKRFHNIQTLVFVEIVQEKRSIFFPNEIGLLSNLGKKALGKIIVPKRFTTVISDCLPPISNRESKFPTVPISRMLSDERSWSIEKSLPRLVEIRFRKCFMMRKTIVHMLVTNRPMSS